MQNKHIHNTLRKTDDLYLGGALVYCYVQDAVLRSTFLYQSVLYVHVPVITILTVIIDI